MIDSKIKEFRSFYQSKQEEDNTTSVKFYSIWGINSVQDNESVLLNYYFQ